MSPSSTPHAVRPGPRGADQLVKSLVTEFAEEKKKEREAERRQRHPSRRFVAPTIALVTCLAAWVAPLPDPVDAPAAPDARYTMASARMTLVLASRRVEAFRTQYRRLPTTLDDAGVSERGMIYTRNAGGTFVLKLPINGSFLTFDSGMAPAMFLEDALTIIRRTAK